MILCIETATGVCSVALCDDNSVISVIEAPPGISHSSRLTVIIHELLKGARVEARQLDAVSVSKGPGSYTGLRIGVSVAKGIAYGAGIPLIGINTLTAMCHGYLTANPLAADSSTLLCPMIDARRMEVYNALFTSEVKMLRETSADIINGSSYSETKSERIIFFGSRADKCRSAITSTNAIFAEGFSLVHHICTTVGERPEKSGLRMLPYFEPYYLKEFIATIPKSCSLRKHFRK
jgi:tRNA threonylcarbamoyladenosine biosynthesis protein TsaB